MIASAQRIMAGDDGHFVFIAEILGKHDRPDADKAALSKQEIEMLRQIARMLNQAMAAASQSMEAQTGLISLTKSVGALSRGLGGIGATQVAGKEAKEIRENARDVQMDIKNVIQQLGGMKDDTGLKQTLLATMNQLADMEPKGKEGSRVVRLVTLRGDKVAAMPMLDIKGVAVEGAKASAVILPFAPKDVSVSNFKAAAPVSIVVAATQDKSFSAAPVAAATVVTQALGASVTMPVENRMASVASMASAVAAQNYVTQVAAVSAVAATATSVSPVSVSPLSSPPSVVASISASQASAPQAAAPQTVAAASPVAPVAAAAPQNNEVPVAPVQIVAQSAEIRPTEIRIEAPVVTPIVDAAPPTPTPVTVEAPQAMHPQEPQAVAPIGASVDGSVTGVQPTNNPPVNSAGDPPTGSSDPVAPPTAGEGAKPAPPSENQARSEEKPAQKDKVQNRGSERDQYDEKVKRDPSPRRYLPDEKKPEVVSFKSYVHALSSSKPIVSFVQHTEHKVKDIVRKFKIASKGACANCNGGDCASCSRPSIDMASAANKVAALNKG